MRGSTPEGLIWEMVPSRREERENRSHAIHGTLVLDIDGTLTQPDDPYAIETAAIEELAGFLQDGGNLVFCSGATLGRIERTVLTPLYHQTKGAVRDEQATQRLFKQVIVMPETGSALLLNRWIGIEENELYFDWFRIHELHVPDKTSLRHVIEGELVPLRPDSYLGGDHLEDRGQRDYMLSWKNVCKMNSVPSVNQPTTRDLVEHIRQQIVPRHPEINWKGISMWPARTTIDFVNADSGKTISILWLLREAAGFGGPVVGFGDLGDEFAEVIPTVNVNKRRPNEFRMRGQMPAIDLNGEWVLLDQNNYAVAGQGCNTIVVDRTTAKEITVLRDGQGMILFAEQNGDGLLTPTFPRQGHPVEIRPIKTLENGQPYEVEDAGKGTAWMIRKLVAAGYFK